MSAEQHGNHNQVYSMRLTRRFEKKLLAMDEEPMSIIEDQLDAIIENPFLGKLKTGELGHVRVHKFKVFTQEVLLAYTIEKTKLTIFALDFGPHENFYRDLQNRKKADLKIIKSS